MNPVGKLSEPAAHPLSFRRRILAKALPVFMFTLVFPVILFILPKLLLDRWLQLPAVPNTSSSVILSGCLIALGLIFTLWSIKAQREIGLGTPMPLQPTLKLVVQKPYSYCRNPLFFGVVNLFIGISIWLGSISSLMMVGIFSAIILIYTRFVEEKELEKRYGEEYLAYKKSTPFFIPIHLSIRRNK